MTPDETTFRVLDWAFAGLGALGGIILKMFSSRIDNIERRAQATETSIDHKLSELFNRLDAHSQKSADNHKEILKAVYEGLAGKADK